MRRRGAKRGASASRIRRFWALRRKYGLQRDRGGATVYLPVSVPDALLYVGDGHALQGDGELNGNALETSMDVEFTVELVKDKRIPSPRVENADYLMAMALAGSLDDAFRQATANMTMLLMNDYKLTPS